VSTANSPNIEIGIAIRELRTTQGLTQGELAVQAGVNKGLVSKNENGRANPTWRTVVSITDALEVSLISLARRVEARSSGRDWQ
jgi:XRE family transcriptional regulator, regulator of sulfur utilization